MLNEQEAYTLLDINPIDPNLVLILNNLYAELNNASADANDKDEQLRSEEDEQKLTAVNLLLRTLVLAPTLKGLETLINDRELQGDILENQIIKLTTSTQDLQIIHFRLMTSLDHNHDMSEKVKEERKLFSRAIKIKQGFNILRPLMMANPFEIAVLKKQIFELVDSNVEIEMIHTTLMESLNLSNLAVKDKVLKRSELKNIKNEVENTIKAKWTKKLLAELEKAEKADVDICLNCFFNGADVNTQHRNGFMMLHVFILADNISALETILNKSTPDLNISHMGDTLQPAAIYLAKNADIIELLVSHGADLTQLNPATEDVFRFLITFLKKHQLKGFQKDLLQITNCDMMDKLVTQVVEACLTDKLKCVKRKAIPAVNSPEMIGLINNLSIQRSDRDDRIFLSDLMQLIEYNNEKQPAFQYFLQKKLATPQQLLQAELDKPGLSKATDNGQGQEIANLNGIVNLNVILGLLDQGAPLNTVGKTSGTTAAHIIVSQLNLDIAKLSSLSDQKAYQALLEGSLFSRVLESDCTICNLEGLTAISLMSDRLKGFYQDGMNVKKQAEKPDIEQLNHLLGLELEQRENANIQNIGELIRQGANVNIASAENGWTIPHIAAYTNNQQLLDALAKKGANFNFPAKNGAHPLAYANNIQTICALLQGGADLQLKDKTSITYWSGLCKKNLINKSNAITFLISLLKSDEPEKHLVSIKALIQLVDNKKQIKKTLEKSLNTKLQKILSNSKPSLFRFISPNKTNKPALDVSPKKLKESIINRENFDEKRQGASRWNQFVKAKMITKENVNALLAIALDVTPERDKPFIMRLLAQPGVDSNTRGTITGWTALHVAAQEGDLAAIAQLAKHPHPTDFNVKNDTDGCTPLFLAKNIDVVKALLQGGADLSCVNQHGLTALNFLLAEKVITVADVTDILAIVLDAKNPNIDVIDILIDFDANVDIQGQKTGFSAAHIAAKQGNKPVLMKLAAQKADFNLAAKNPQIPPLCYAILNIQAAKILIQGGADLSFKVNKQESLFDILLKQLGTVQDKSMILSHLLDAPAPNIDFIKRLIQAEADVNTVGENTGLCALHMAAQEGDIDFIKLLTRKKAKPNLKENAFFRTPLFYAKNDETVITLFNECGADHTVKDSDGTLFIQHLLNNVNIDVAGLNRMLTAELAKQKEANIEWVKLCIHSGADANCKDKQSGFTAMLLAVAQNDQCFIKELQEKRDSVNVIQDISFSFDDFISSSKDEIVISPFSVANNIEMVKNLIQLGENIEHIGQSEESVLQELINKGVVTSDNAADILAVILDVYTSQTPRLASIRKLIQLGAHVNTQGEKTGRTTAHIAAGKKDDTLLQELADKGADFNLKLKIGGEFPPLFSATHFNTVAILVKGGADLVQACGEWIPHRYLASQDLLPIENANTLLAVILDNLNYPYLVDTITVLLGSGASADIQGDQSYRTAAHIAALHDNIPLIKLLCEKAKNAVADKMKNASGDPEMAATLAQRSLLTINEYLNREDFEGNLPISCTNNIDIVLALIAAGVPYFEKAEAANSIRYLIKAELLTPENATAMLTLELAKAEPDLAIIKDLILERNAAVDTQHQRFGYRAIHHAVTNNDVEFIKALIDKKANFNVLNPAGRSLISYAENNLELIKLLIRGGAPLFVRNEYNHAICMMNPDQITPEIANQLLAIALDNFDYPDLIATTQILLEIYGANINLHSEIAGKTPLHFAVAMQKSVLLERLLEKETIEVDALDATGSSPLFYAKDSATVFDLLEKQANYLLVNTAEVPAYHPVITTNITDAADKTAAKNMLIKQDIAGKGPDDWNQPLLAECADNDTVTQLRLMKKLSKFIDNDVKRLLKLKPEQTYDLKAKDIFKDVPRSAQHKIILYSRLKKQIDADLLKADGRNVLGFIKEAAIIAHHRRHRTCNKIVKVLSLGFFSHNEAVSWNHFKQFAKGRVKELKSADAVELLPASKAALVTGLKDVVFFDKSRKVTIQSRKTDKMVEVKGYEAYREHHKTAVL